MFSIVEKEILRNRERNEIFYSLSQYDLYSIRKQIASSVHPEYLDIIIDFDEEEIDRIFKILSTTYVLPNKDDVDYSIWETYISGKILEVLQRKKAVSFHKNLETERNLLMSFKLNRYLDYFPNRTTVQTINDLARDRVTKRIRVHYFPGNVMMPISLQKALNRIFATAIFFNNMMYTSAGSLNSHYNYDGKWLGNCAAGPELWQVSPKTNEEITLGN